jgi:hypothetical protein
VESISLDSYYFCVFNSIFAGLTKPTFFVSFRLSGKPRSTEEKSVVKGPMDLDLSLTEEKSENRLGDRRNGGVGCYNCGDSRHIASD